MFGIPKSMAFAVRLLEPPLEADPCFPLQPTLDYSLVRTLSLDAPSHVAVDVASINKCGMIIVLMSTERSPRHYSSSGPQPQTSCLVGFSHSE